MSEIRRSVYYGNATPVKNLGIYACAWCISPSCEVRQDRVIDCPRLDPSVRRDDCRMASEILGSRRHLARSLDRLHTHRACTLSNGKRGKSSNLGRTLVRTPSTCSC